VFDEVLRVRTGQWESDEELAALTHVDLLSVERDAAMQHPMTRSTSNKFRVERCTSRTSEQAVILEKNKTAIGFYCRVRILLLFACFFSFF